MNFINFCRKMAFLGSKTWLNQTIFNSDKLKDAWLAKIVERPKYGRKEEGKVVEKILCHSSSSENQHKSLGELEIKWEKFGARWRACPKWQRRVNLAAFVIHPQNLFERNPNIILVAVSTFAGGHIFLHFGRNYSSQNFKFILIQFNSFKSKFHSFTSV